jgi:transposase-like protein
MYCPNCKSSNLTKQGSRWRTINNQRVKIQQFICNTCGKYTTEPLSKVKDTKGKVVLLENKLKEI